MVQSADQVAHHSIHLHEIGQNKNLGHHPQISSTKQNINDIHDLLEDN